MKARTVFEHKSVNKKILQTLYEKYTTVPDCKQFIERASDLFPKLNCGLASVYLQYLLKKGRIIQGKYGENNHTFLLVKNTIIDITADQYGGPKIYIGPLQVPWSLK